MRNVCDLLKFLMMMGVELLHFSFESLALQGGEEVRLKLSPWSSY